MQRQLFLFDLPEETKPPQEPPLPADAATADIVSPVEKPAQGTPTHTNSNEVVMLVNENDDASEEEAVTLDFTAAVTTGNETAEEENNTSDPFAALEQQRQEQVENMLLLPNIRRGRKSFKDMDAEAILVDVPDDEELYKKQYYPMRVVADWFGITQSQLRNWENEFDILKPKKNAKGDRFFRPDDVKNLQLIYHLIRKRKFTLQGAKQYLQENKKSLQTTIQLTDALNKLKQFLTELKAITGE